MQKKEETLWNSTEAYLGEKQEAPRAFIPKNTVIKIFLSRCSYWTIKSNYFRQMSILTALQSMLISVDISADLLQIYSLWRQHEKETQDAFFNAVALDITSDPFYASLAIFCLSASARLLICLFATSSCDHLWKRKWWIKVAIILVCIVQGEQWNSCLGRVF